MDLGTLVGQWLKARLHVKPHQLKGAPGVHDETAAADHVNTVIGALIDSHVAAQPSPDAPETAQSSPSDGTTARLEAAK